MRTEEITKSMATAYIDSTINSNLAYRPEFVSNDYRQGKKVLVSIDKELNNCDEFCISVAFIKMSGITPLLMTLKELELKGIPGKIITTDYQIFTEPKALDKLAELKNISLKIYKCDPSNDGFHTKGYIFRKDELYRIIIGSSNMTISAITTNREWNTKIVSTQDGQVAKDILDEFKDIWDDSKCLNYDEYIDEYRQKYVEQQIIRRQQRQAAAENVVNLERYMLKPNKMQVAFIDNLMRLVNDGVDRALLLSSTGTGKTYASAFAMRELGYKKVLFLVHRNQIAKQAIKSYHKVFGNSVSMGMMSSALGRMEYDKDYIFATIQTFAKDENLHRFEKTHFDAIIYDEAHHACADSYRKVMDYFTPRLSLGMTATPDRRDADVKGRDIYEVFGHNIAYEIGLQQAMEEDLLCPFHYFGITDLNIDDEVCDTDNFRFLTSDERVKYVMSQARYYGYSGSRVKGLIFCSRIEEAKELSRKFNENGLRTIALSGADTEETRANAIERLAMEECDATEVVQPLDYILSVDIFSEGTDIIEVNQVIMLRPTQSPIVFIQQLGRGLRKAEGKEYVVVLDFIGNYRNNFMIPIALSGDRTYNKDTVRHYVTEGSRIIPGSSTLHFDEISKKKIFSSIDNANFSDIKLIKENYFNLKNKLGHIPALTDFDKYGEMDVLRIFDNNSLGSYYKFLVKYDPDYKVRLSDEKAQVIEFISKKIANGKRAHELVLLKEILKGQRDLIINMADTLHREYGLIVDRNCAENVVNIFTNEFPAGVARATYKNCVLIEPAHNAFSRLSAYASLLNNNTDYEASPKFMEMLSDKAFRSIIEELVDFGLARYERDYRDSDSQSGFALYRKYTYEDVCRILNWAHNEVPLNIGGYKYDDRTKTFPIFINYDKADDISDTTRYEDHFTTSNTLIAISKSGRTRKSTDVVNMLEAKQRGIKVELFVRKNKDDKISKEFYYLGSMQAKGVAQEFVMANTDKTAVEIEWELDVPVREDIYEYITQG